MRGKQRDVPHSKKRSGPVSSPCFSHSKVYYEVLYNKIDDLITGWLTSKARAHAFVPSFPNSSSF